MELINRMTGEVVAETVDLAHSFGRRFKGLMFRKNLPESYALHIRPCRSIHTFFMKFPIDVLYLDSANNIVGIQEKLEPGMIGKKFYSAKSVVELPAGQIRKTGTIVGQGIQFK